MSERMETPCNTKLKSRQMGLGPLIVDADCYVPLSHPSSSTASSFDSLTGHRREVVPLLGGIATMPFCVDGSFGTGTSRQQMWYR